MWTTLSYQCLLGHGDALLDGLTAGMGCSWHDAGAWEEWAAVDTGPHGAPAGTCAEASSRLSPQAGSPSRWPRSSPRSSEPKRPFLHLDLRTKTSARPAEIRERRTNHSHLTPSPPGSFPPASQNLNILSLKIAWGVRGAVRAADVGRVSHRHVRTGHARGRPLLPDR